MPEILGMPWVVRPREIYVVLRDCYGTSGSLSPNRPSLKKKNDCSRGIEGRTVEFISDFCMINFTLSFPSTVFFCLMQTLEGNR